MSMEDKILDDDDIIDLTDLLEEGEPGKKSAPKKEQPLKGSTQLNEPDSFDLGKEISMEYDVSVEEIDQGGGENLDVSAGLSASEEIALTEDKSVKEDLILEDKEVRELTLPDGDKALKEEPILEDSEIKELDLLAEEPAAAEPAPKEPEARVDAGVAEDLLADGPVSDAGAKAAPETDETLAVLEDAEPLPFEEEAAPAVEPVKAAPAAEIAEAAPALELDRQLPEEAPAPAPVAVDREELAAELRQQAPALIEALVKPLMEDLVREMVAATREMLPGIVEKVIREEIEKLKKLGS